MSIASAIQNAQQKVANAYTAVSDKGGTLPTTRNLSNLPTAIRSIPGGTPVLATKTITENGTYNASDDGAQGYSQVTVDVQEGQWSPDPLWWDIETILQNDPDLPNYGGSYIYLINDDSDTAKFSIYKATATPLENSPVAAKTSDGTMYTITSSSNYQTITHTWDKTKDKQSSDPNVKTRYIMFYTPSNRCNATPPTVGLGVTETVLYAVYNVSPSLTNQSQYFGVTYRAYMLQAFKFVNGHSTRGKTNFQNFCNGCHNLVLLPEGVDTSSGTNFYGFCSQCMCLRKMPQLDVSKGTSFNQFLVGCSALTGEYSFDVSLCTSFSGFFDRAGSSSAYFKIKFGSSLTSSPSILDYTLSRNLDLDMSGVANSSNSVTITAWGLENVKVKLPRCNFTFNSIPTLSKESMQYIADNAPTVTSKTLRLGSVNIARAGGATGTIISTLTSKGWTVN